MIEYIFEANYWRLYNYQNNCNVNFLRNFKHNDKLKFVF